MDTRIIDGNHSIVTDDSDSTEQTIPTTRTYYDRPIGTLLVLRAKMGAEERLLSITVVVVQRHKWQQRKLLQVRNHLVLKQQNLHQPQISVPSYIHSIRSK